MAKGRAVTLLALYYSKCFGTYKCRFVKRIKIANLDFDAVLFNWKA